MNGKKNADKNKRGKLYYSFQAISMVPLLLYGIVVIIFSSATFQKGMQQQVSTELKNVASLVSLLLDTAYPGDYSLTDDNTLSLYKGDINLTDEYGLIDAIGERIDMDVTLFYQDIRILTTIKNGDGERIVGSQAPEQIVADVLEQGKSRFYDNVIIRGTSYFAYYTPLHNSDGQITGILFVGRIRSALPLLLLRCLLCNLLPDCASTILFRQQPFQKKRYPHLSFEYFPTEHFVT